MQFLEWNQCYEVGIVDIDVDHRRLFAAYNRFALAIQEQKTSQAIQDEFATIATLMQQHFHAEEIHLQRLACPDWEAHQQIHKLLILELQVRQKNLLELLAKPHKALHPFAENFRNWMVGHIAEDAEDLQAATAGIAIQTGSAV
jgi:hemerythrin-like metal-binding protein